MWDVAVIGAGLSGITCARQLAATGQRVCILDKSRGLGGRMATRRVLLQSAAEPSGARSGDDLVTNDTVRVDHGLRYWQPKTEGLQALTAELVTAGVLKQWPVNAYEILTREVLTPAAQSAPFYVADAGMSAIAKYLSGGFTLGENLLTDHRAMSLRYSKDHWRIECEATETIVARQCAIATPVPQAIDLLKTVSKQRSADDERGEAIAAAIAKMECATYHPCITVLAGYDAQYQRDALELVPGDVSAGWMVTDKVGTSTDWVGLDSSKRSNNPNQGPVIVIHSKPDFARQYLETGDLQPAASVLLRASARKLKPWIAQPSWFQIQRWRYAQVNAAHPESAVTVLPSLVCGGDWCVPAAQADLQNIDDAYLSGLAMAEAIA